MRWVLSLTMLAFTLPIGADGPRDNLADNVRPVPPPGIAVPNEVRSELQTGLDSLGKTVDRLRQTLKGKPALLALVPDVEIYHKAVRYVLTYGEFYNKREFQVAANLLSQGEERAESLLKANAPWTTQTGLVARGYVSKIDGSVQPYGLVVPASYRPDSPHRFRLDVWCHGRGENLTELNFINGVQRSKGEFTPANAFVLHLYGRYCCANKLAGEVDLFEALADVRKNYPIDENRLVIRGFSMGGAACWQFAVHHAGMWAAAAPGAGFSETADFLKVFQKETLRPAWYEQKLWHMYDCTDYAVNLYNCPTVAYSGELDSQKQAADMMEKAMTKEGLTLLHIIGPKTYHAYHLRAKAEIIRRVDSIVERGRDPVPRKVRFITWTLRYNQMLWVTVDGLGEHWSRARVDAEIVGPQKVKVKTKNVTAVTLSMPPGRCPLEVTGQPVVIIDEQKPLTANPVQSDRSWVTHFRKDADGTWKVLAAEDQGLRKRHGLQGPIDDAFLDSFIFVRPTGKPLNDKIGAWAHAEMDHAVTHWRRQFRGDARVKEDKDITDRDIAGSNLVLWGDPGSNRLIAKVLPGLPMQWTAKDLHLGHVAYDAGHNVPVMIYPNPLNPKRYVVLNSGFTFREYDYLNNARQVPKLPDFAVIDVATPPNARWPGKVNGAGFFNERWELPAPTK